MSLRPVLYAVNVEPMISVVQSNDISLLPKVINWFREHLDNPDVQTLALAEQETRRLLCGELACGIETEDHVNIVYAMADVLGLQESDAVVADGNWKHGAWADYLDGVQTVIDADGLVLLEMLTLTGRPLFGTEIDSTWPYYAYLRREEVRVLLSALNAAAKTNPEIASDDFIEGFHEELTDWLSGIDERNTDLWMYAS